MLDRTFPGAINRKKKKQCANKKLIVFNQNLRLGVLDNLS